MDDLRHIGAEVLERAKADEARNAAQRGAKRAARDTADAVKLYAETVGVEESYGHRRGVQITTTTPGRVHITLHQLDEGDLELVAEHLRSGGTVTIDAKMSDADARKLIDAMPSR